MSIELYARHKLIDTRALTMPRKNVIMESYAFDIYSIDKKITNIDGSHNLEKRTKVPLELTEAHAVALKYSRLGHIIEYRKVAAEA